jgi:uncharacterized protein YjbJ (UPF0337 family)
MLTSAGASRSVGLWHACVRRHTNPEWPPSGGTRIAIRIGINRGEPQREDAPKAEEHVMHHDELKGKVEQVQGKVKQAIGRATDDPVLHDEGRADEAAGEVREGVGKVKRTVGEAIEDVGERIKR